MSVAPKTQDDRRRYASFISTTNNLRPLCDSTGSRRFICINIPSGMLIDNETEIDYQQLYAQVVSELKNNEVRYWFNNEEVIRIQQLNSGFVKATDLESVVGLCFRKPKNGEEGTFMSLADIIGHIANVFPDFSMSQKQCVKLGIVLSNKGYEKKNSKKGRMYCVIIK